MENAPAPSTNLGPLPKGWERINYASGISYWMNRSMNIITYYDPRQGNPHPDGFATVPVDGAPLPNGWEAVRRGDGPLFFLDHHAHTSTTDDPRTRGGTGDGAN